MNSYRLAVFLRVSAWLALVGLLMPAASAVVWYVDVDHTSGTQDGLDWATAFPTIQQGVDAALAGGGEVWVAEGTYTSATSPVVALQGTVELYGGFAGAETLRTQRDVNMQVTAISGGAPGVSAQDVSVLDGFQVRSGNPGVRIVGGNPIIRNCRIAGNTAYGTPGASPPMGGNGGWGGSASAWGVTIGASAPVFENCFIAMNGAQGGAGGNAVGSGYCVYFSGGNGGNASGGGVYMDSSASAAFTNCVFSDNYAIPGGGGAPTCSSQCGCGTPGVAGTAWGAAIFFQGISLSVTNCTFTRNTHAAIVGPGTLAVTNSIFRSNGTNGLPTGASVTYSDVQGGYAGTGNLDVDPLFVNADGGDFHLQPTSPCIDAGSLIPGLTTDFEWDARGYDGYAGPRGDGSDFDIGADEYTGGFVDGICYVDKDSPGPVRNGRSWATALRKIQHGIDAASAGEEVWVKGAVYRETIWMKSGVGLYGGFAGTETERGQRDVRANVTTIDATTLDSRYHVVMMVTLSNARLDGFTITGGYGFSGTSSDKRGSGIKLTWVDATNTIANCVVTGNSNQGQGGGMYFWYESSPLVVDCIIAGNAADYGGGVYCYQSAPTFLRCVVSGNSATKWGGAFNTDACAPTFTNCVVTGNVAGEYGGGFYCGGTGTTSIITNCTVCYNASNWLAGGGIHVLGGSNPVITNCIFTKNGGGAIREAATNCDPVVRNCLFRDNWDSDYYNENSTPLTGAAAINALAGNSGNVDGVPAFAQDGPGQIAGTWTAAPAYDAGAQRTTLTDANATFTPNAFVNRLINGDVDTGAQALIVANTETQIIVLGDVTGYAQNGDAYKLADYRLTPGSAAVDTGTGVGAPADDILGVARPQGNGFDIGAYELLISLPEALDNVAQAWTTGGTVAWFGQTALSHDGVDAARSGAITHNQSSELTTQVTGPGTLSFWWKVSSESGHDFLRFSVDGVLQDRISGEVYFNQKQYVLGEGTHLLKWKYSKDAAGTAGRDAAWLDQVGWSLSTISLADALDNTALAWTTTGNAGWLGQAAITHDHVDAAQSAVLAHGQCCELSTRATGPGNISFWWKVSSEAGHDFLRFSIDGVLQGRISGDVYFNQKQYALGSGTHLLKWKYSKDASGTAGRDAAWVDEVIWTPDGKALSEGALRISSVLAGGWMRQGDCQTLTAETAGGRFPLEYQWRKDGHDLVGATEDTLTISSVTESDSGTYKVEVRDADGATCSTSTKLTVTDSLPGPAGIALAVLIGLCGLAGIRRTRR